MITSLSIVVGLVLLLLISFKYLIPSGFTNGYQLPPGPKQTPIFGNLLELMHSSFLKNEPPFQKFASWAFQVIRNKTDFFKLKFILIRRRKGRANMLPAIFQTKSYRNLGCESSTATLCRASR